MKKPSHSIAQNELTMSENNLADKMNETNHSTVEVQDLYKVKPLHVFFIIDGNRRWAKREYLKYLYFTDKETFEDKINEIVGLIIQKFEIDDVEVPDSQTIEKRITDRIITYAETNKDPFYESSNEIDFLDANFDIPEEFYFNAYGRGAEIVTTMIKFLLKLSIKEVSIFGLSINNLMRSWIELQPIINVQQRTFENWLDDDIINGNVRIVGDLEEIKKYAPSYFETCKKLNEKNGKSNHHVNILVGYDADSEIQEAASRWHNQLSNPLKILSRLKGRKKLSEFLDINSQIDLIIRTGGIQRISGALPLQSKEAEYVFSKVYWPDFNNEEFLKVIKEYGKRVIKEGR